jgi:hypothetical protein
VRQRLAHDVDRAAERDVEGAVEVVGIDLEEVPEHARRGIRHDHVEAAERVGRLRDRALDRGPVGGVRGHDHGFVRHPLELVATARQQGEPGPLRGEQARGFEPDPGAGAGDQDALAGKWHRVRRAQRL